MNIYAKLTLLCLFLVVISSSVIFIFTNKEVKQAYRNELLISVNKQAEATISSIEQFIFSRINDVNMATKNPYFRASNITNEELTSRLQELETLNEIYYSFSFFDMNKIRVADSKRQSVGKQESNYFFWDAINAGDDRSMDVTKSASLDRPVMEFAALVTPHQDDTPKGVLVGRILVEELFKIMGDISLSEDSIRQLEVNLLNKDGLVLYSNDKSTEPLKTKFKDFDLIKNANSQDSRVNLVETKSKIYFVAKQRSYAHYDGNDWILSINLDKEQAFLPLDVIQKHILNIILYVLGFSIILSLVAANVFVKPIVKLSKDAEEIGKGNLDVDIDIKSNDEVGKLARQLAGASKNLVKKLEEQRESNKQLETQKSVLEDQRKQLELVNEQVADSIVYAQRIQNSILPDVSSLKRVMKDAFILYKPKDVVSGDFYWFERIRQGRNEYLVVACADCTGHGVPGAIMSIMGSNLITNIVYYQNYLDPNKILARMNKLIKMELQRDGEEQNRDGMEIGICVINLDDLNMEFSGAGIPLYLIRDGELLTYKSTKAMVGGIEGDEREAVAKIKKELIELKEGDRLFMASDGYQDQFGGPDDKKFMVKNFKKLLVETASLPMPEQEAKLNAAIENWMGDQGHQTDDIAVLGVEIK